MSTPEGPVTGLVFHDPAASRWTTGATALLLGILTFALLAVGLFTGLIAGLADFGGKSEAEARFWTIAAVVAFVLAAGCATAAIATGTFAIARGRQQALAVTGLVLGLFPVLGTGAWLLVSVI